MGYGVLKKAGQESSIQSCITGSATSFTSPLMRAFYADPVNDQLVTVGKDYVQFSAPTARQALPPTDYGPTQRVDMVNYWISLDPQKTPSSVSTGHYDRSPTGHGMTGEYQEDSVVLEKNLSPDAKAFLNKTRGCVQRTFGGPS
jgi:hypothetical protein